MQTEPLRLTRNYRGYRRGEVIQATAGLAKTLVEAGVAEPVKAAPRIPGLEVERAVESVVIETR
jgi:hypothetical protein